MIIGMTENVFDKLAKRYDDWFETSEGKIIFKSEVNCLRKLVDTKNKRWCEIGVGTGRFAQALGIEEGIDPSAAVLEFARRRGITVIQALAENLPFANESFDGLLMTVTVCFLDNPELAFREAHRVLKKQGAFVVGFVPAESDWGKKYIKQAQQGHPFYSAAKFYMVSDIKKLAQDSGFICSEAYSCLLVSPYKNVSYAPPVSGAEESAGFVAMKFSK